LAPASLAALAIAATGKVRAVLEVVWSKTTSAVRPWEARTCSDTTATQAAVAATVAAEVAVVDGGACLSDAVVSAVAAAVLEVTVAALFSEDEATSEAAAAGASAAVLGVKFASSKGRCGMGTISRVAPVRRQASAQSFFTPP